MRVLKFGGSSVATAERVRRVVSILTQARAAGELTVVVSAFGGVTDTLLRTAALAERRDESYLDLLTELEKRHLAATAELASPSDVDLVKSFVLQALHELRDLLHGVYLLREASPRTRDRLLSYGERLSAAIVAAALRQGGMASEDADARRLILTDDRFGQAQVDFETTYGRIRQSYAEAPKDVVRVVTGFIAATPDGETTTLGRGGSDYTASILGAALGAEAVELWTDVSGVLSADPRFVPDAAPIAKMSYEELMELSHFGAKVVHPPSVHPTRNAKIPLLIKNTFDPEAPGTRVTAEPLPDQPPVRGVTSIGRVALLRIEGAGMVGVPGVASRVFGALGRRQVNVILISQASSEHSICLAVTPESLTAADEALREEFALERRVGLLDDPVVEPDMAAVAVVGGGMRRHLGTAGRLFAMLGAHGINVHAIAQGSSELNISLVVSAADDQRAVRTLHEAFLFPGRRTVALFLAGVGRVGGTFLAQLGERQQALLEERGLRLQLVAVAGRRGVLVEDEGILPGEAIERLRVEEGALVPLGEAVERFRHLPMPHKVFIDCTASDEIPALYEEIRGAGIALVTANKRRLAGPMASYRELMAAGPGHLYYETTAGAGLPVTATLKALLLTGDRLHRLEGLLSGTLSYLCEQLAGGLRFSEAVRQAYDLGYTEPDPRDDLGGLDVARKLLILGRLAGFELELGEVEVESWLPDASWSEGSIEGFWTRLPELDDAFAARQKEARDAGKHLRYLASLDGTGARVCLSALDSDHPCAGVRGSDNLIALYTDRYSETPLVVRGPGAGPDVTAAGVFADVLQAIAEANWLTGGL